MVDIKVIQDTLRIIAEWAQNITFIILIVLLISSVQWMKLNKMKMAYEVPVLLLAIHALVFYSYNILVRENLLAHPVIAPFFTYWSALLRCQEFATILMMVVLRLCFSRDREHHAKENGKS